MPMRYATKRYARRRYKPRRYKRSYGKRSSYGKYGYKKKWVPYGTYMRRKSRAGRRRTYRRRY